METNKQIALKVLKGAFIERDATVVDRTSPLTMSNTIQSSQTERGRSPT